MNVYDRLLQSAEATLVLFPIVICNDVQYVGANGIARVCGRVNLVGDHTDNNDGFVLDMTTDRITGVPN